MAGSARPGNNGFLSRGPGWDQLFFFQGSPAGSQVKRSRQGACRLQPMLAPSLATEAQGPRRAASVFISRRPGTCISAEPAGKRGDGSVPSGPRRFGPAHGHLRLSELRPSPGRLRFPAPPRLRGPQASALPVPGCQVTTGNRAPSRWPCLREGDT